MSQHRQSGAAFGLAAAGPTRPLFGEPYETGDGTTIITVSRSTWTGRSTAPLGIYVVRDGETSWQPAVDATRIALLGETIGLAAAVIATLAVLRRPPWPDLSRPRHPSTPRTPRHTPHG